MLQRDYTSELISYVQELSSGQILNKPMIDAIRISVEEHFWVDDVTAYNIRQMTVIAEEEDYTSEERADAIIESTYNTSFVKTFAKVKERDYIKKSRILWGVNDFLEHVQTYLSSYVPHDSKIFRGRKSVNDETLVVALTDLHLWKKGSDVIVDRLNEIVDNISSTTVTHVDIFCVWDLVETLVQWWMHDGQVETMWDTYGFDLLMKTVEIFENFLLSIQASWISITFHWLSGNHDRMTKDRDWDKTRIGWLIIYELIKRWLSQIEWIKINIIQDYITTVDIDSIRYIVAHWDMARIPKRKWSDIAWIHWDNTKSHNVIMHWHLHNVSITEEKGITKIWLPWLAGTDQYATKELDLHSEPGYVHITHNKHWSVDILIKRLTND